MKHHVLGRFWIGLGTGMVIGVCVTLIISYFTGDGTYLAVMPHLSALFASELDAVAVQFLLFGVVGVTFAEAGIILSLERWNFPIKCLLHFLVTSSVYLPFLYLCYFNRETVWMLLLILANALLTYVISWITSYVATRGQVDSINRHIAKLRERGEG